MFQKLWKKLEKCWKNRKKLEKGSGKIKKNNWKMVNSTCIYVYVIYCQYLIKVRRRNKEEEEEDRKVLYKVLLMQAT